MQIPAADQACPPVTTLRQLHQGLLDEQEMADLEHHLDACPTCAKSLDQLWPPPGAKVSGTESDRDSDSLVNQLVATGNVLTAPILRPPLVPGDLGRLGKYRVMEKLGKVPPASSTAVLTRCCSVLWFSRFSARATIQARMASGK